MTSVISIQSGNAGAAFQTEVHTVRVHEGRRGPTGLTGDQGDKGDDGSSVVSRGAWVSGTEYCPLDMVTAPSSTGVGGVTSSYIQKSSWPCEVSTVSPELDPARWDEVGYTDFGDALGNIWEVVQVGHAFTELGLGVQWDGTVDRYVLSNVTGPATELPLAVIREIPSSDTLILQSSGLLPAVGMITSDGPWQEDTVYYGRDSGLVAKTPPATGFVVPVLHYLNGEAIVFPYQNADAVVPPTPAPAPATTHIKLDAIAFDGTTTQYPLLSGASPVPFGPAESFHIVMDGHDQEPLVDFSIADNGGNAEIVFGTAPADYVTFWGVYAV